VDLLLTWKLVHLLVLVYWLGGDLGTFYASRFVADAALGPAQRATAARIMLGVDLAPRICMPLALATGVQLAALQRVLPLGGAGVAAAWLLCGLWLAGVLGVHHLGPVRGAALAKADSVLRVAFVAMLVAVALLPSLFGWPRLPPWVAMKLLAFAGTVVCGLMIRRRLRPFGAAFGRLMQGGSDPRAVADANAVVAASIRRCVPFVLAIWVLLVLCAALGLHLVG
jgi:hypothetical protein